MVSCQPYFFFFATRYLLEKNKLQPVKLFFNNRQKEIIIKKKKSKTLYESNILFCLTSYKDSLIPFDFYLILILI